MDEINKEINKVALELFNKHFGDESITTEELFEIGIKMGMQMERKRLRIIVNNLDIWENIE